MSPVSAAEGFSWTQEALIQGKGGHISRERRMQKGDCRGVVQGIPPPPTPLAFELLLPISWMTREDAVAPRTLTWPKGSDTISKNETLSSVTSARALRSPHSPSRAGAMTPTPSLSSQALSSPRLPRTEEVPSQPVSTGPGGVSSSTLSRMGAVPVMVPAQSQAWSLV